MSIYKLHYDIFKETSELLKKGKKRISLIMPTGTGGSNIVLDLAATLLNNPIIIVKHSVICEQLSNLLEERHQTNQIKIVKYNDFVSSPIFDVTTEFVHCSSYVLFNIASSERQKLSLMLPKDATIVSFGNVFQPDERSFESFVFYQEQILDIRDIIVADSDERQRLLKQISDKKALLEKRKFAFATAPINASSEASDEEIKALKQKLEEKNKKISEMEETIHIQETLLKSAGIDIETLRESVSLIKTSRAKFVNNDSEEAASAFAKIISEQCTKLFSAFLTPINKENYASQIESCISKKVWDKLESDSKTCLITGKIAFQSLLNNTDGSMDYSGVCILAAKALDIEMSKRFFVQYLEYLKKNYDYEKWPNTLFDKNDELLTEDELTLGAIKYLTGIDENGKMRSRYINQMFLQYAKSELYPSSFSNNDIQQHLKKCIRIIEKVRTEYRNPAAHRDSINQITAKDCLDYLVDTYKKLKEILEVIK